MNVAIIDADLIGKKKHRFPNLACMKISGYQKEQGNKVTLKLDYDNLTDYDQVFISKVFTDTPIDPLILQLNNVIYGGTGFYYDQAQPLPYEVEHHMPDYHLYDNWVNEQLESGGKRIDYKYYLDYSIGYTTRGCFRHCEFCVNKNYNRVELHSPLSEFFDPTRKKLCLLDDNVFGYSKWKEIFIELQSTGKPFQYKQGLDERLLTDEKCEVLFSSKYDSDYIFAFDNIADYELIERKLKLIREYTDVCPKFYVFCGFDRNNKWDYDFWVQDIFDMMKRIQLLQEYHCLPYIMRFNRYIESPYQGVYKVVAAWCNQPSFFKKKSLLEFASSGRAESVSRLRHINNFLKDNPGFEEYINMKWS